MPFFEKLVRRITSNSHRKKVLTIRLYRSIMDLSKGTERKLTKMASNENKLKDALRNRFLDFVSEKLTANGEEVLRTGSNEIALPCVDEEHNDRWLVITFKVPNGTRDGEAYDGYEEAQGYADKVADKAAKAQAKAEAKAKKIASDKARREAAKAAKAGE